MKIDRVIYHNPDHFEHKGWVDSEGREWDVPGRLFLVIDAILGDDTKRTELFAVPEFHAETLNLIAKVHSVEMIEAISEASRQATIKNPLKTRFDIGAVNDATAIYPGTFEQVLMSAECAASAADSLAKGDTDLAITLSRPPGHHAGKDFYHGFCYINLAAIATEVLKEQGNRVAILDFDVHHGDGTQDIYYDDPNVLYVSLHADPNIVMPGTGHTTETGGVNAPDSIVNYPLPIGVDPETYMQHLDDANKRIKSFKPDFLVIEAGFDGHKNEFPHLPPITQLGDKEYHEIGKKIASLDIPSLVIFGGGYNQLVTSNAFVSYIKGMDSGRSVRKDLYIDRSSTPNKSKYEQKNV